MPTTQTSMVSSWWRGAPKKEGERYHRQQAGDGGGDGLTAVCLLLSQEQCPKAPSISEARAPRSARRTARAVARGLGATVAPEQGRDPPPTFYRRPSSCRRATLETLRHSRPSERRKPRCATACP